MIGSLVAGCGVPLEGGGPLGSVEAWVALDAADDPLPEHRPPDAACAPGGWLVEGGRLEIQMGICAYATLGLPLARPVLQGDPIGILAWHQGLDAPEPGTAHLALFLDDALLWEDVTDIPSVATVFEAEVEAPVDAAVGSTLTLHLHNHGFNAWAVAVPERLE